MNSSTAPWKHVWITGASSGLGEHTARLLARKGCHVSICARSADKLEAIAASSDNITAYTADVADAARLKEVVKEIEEANGPVDLCILSAGTWFQNSIVDLDMERFENTIDINLNGVVRSIVAVLPGMLTRGTGHVSWIASVAGYGGLPDAASYGASKSALIHLAETVRPELEPKGVTVSVINPGFVRTPMTDKNEFDMPFLMEPEDAARKIVDGLAAKKFEIAFPWQLVWLLKILNHLPYGLYFPLIKRLTQ